MTALTRAPQFNSHCDLVLVLTHRLPMHSFAAKPLQTRKSSERSRAGMTLHSQHSTLRIPMLSEIFSHELSQRTELLGYFGGLQKSVGARSEIGPSLRRQQIAGLETFSIGPSSTERHLGHSRLFAPLKPPKNGSL